MRTAHLHAALLTALAAAPALLADCGPFFLAPRVLYQGLSTPADLQLHDLDGMDLPEIVYASRGSFGNTGIAVFRQPSRGVFVQAQVIPLPEFPPILRFLVEDLDLNGTLDLLALDYAAGALRVFPGDGAGTFSTNGPSYDVGPTPTALVLRDLNNDGRRDLLVSNASTSSVSVLMGAAGGGFFPRATVPVGGSSPNWIGLTDINADGRDDLIAVVATPAGITCSLGNGNGTFQTPRFTASPENLTLISPVIQDMTADGVPDVVAHNSSSTKFFVFRGFSNGNFVVTTVNTDTSVGSIKGLAVGDFDANGFPDVVLTAARGDTLLEVMVYPNRPNLNFAPPISFGSYGTNGSASGSNFPVRVGDVNADGATDVFFSDRFGQIGMLEATVGGPVLIGERPQNQTVAPGATVSFSAASPSTGITYRWFKNGQPLLETAKVTGVETSTLSITDAQLGDAAVYECRIIGPCDAKSVSAFLAVAGPINPCPADFDGDGFVDFFDLDAFIAAFEEGC